MIGKANDKSKKIVNNLKISTNNSFKTKSDVYSNDQNDEQKILDL